MKNFKQFLSESVNIAGDFNGNLYINSSEQEPQQPVGESYVADVVWQGSIYRLELVSEDGIPSKQKLAEELQTDYPGAIVHNIYPIESKNSNVIGVKRYHPAKLEWID
jgi:hypothetical protein